ncbi:ATP-binding protein [Anaeromyxobacter oryzisoli]|uniref:ATP-binding protein n=1 Tax=Anaeromyxobacter oryzisoli TaxID=2925408 RepID=UPI001F59D45D|nr:ATP-binding protein [Anaeromyxobacter sp. SG63]
MDLVVLSGLQGAGKTTFYRARFAATHAHVSRDLFRSARDPARRQRQLVEQAAAAGRSVVVDNTSVRRADRAGLVALARALGLRPVLYWFPPDPAASIARNARREGKAQVPVVAILATAKRAEPPAAEEGFDESFEVRAREGGGFDVAPLASPPPPRR